MSTLHSKSVLSPCCISSSESFSRSWFWYVSLFTSLTDIDNIYFYMASTNVHSSLLERPLVHCEAQYGAVICLKYESAFPTMRLAKYFRTYHHYLISLYWSTLQSLKQQALAEDWKDLQYPADWMTPINGLKRMHGFACTECNARTINEKTAKDHSKCQGEVVHTHLQCWNKSATPKYWTVTISEETMPPLLPGILSIRFLWHIDIPLQDVILQRLLQQEYQHEEEETSRRMEPNMSNDMGPWLQYMQWDETFRRKNLSVRVPSCASCWHRAVVDWFNLASPC